MQNIFLMQITVGEEFLKSPEEDIRMTRNPFQNNPLSIYNYRNILN